jgi:hypothetical protein
MPQADRLGITGLIVALFGIAAFYLWPDKKRIGWVSLCLAALLVCVWLVSELKGRRRLKRAEATQGLTVNINPHISPVISPQFNQSQQQSQQLPPEPTPNLICVRVTQEPIYFTDLGFYRATHLPAQQRLCGIAVISNQIIKGGIAPARNVKAELIFRNQQRYEIGRSSPAAWIDHSVHLAQIPPAEVRELLLYTFSEDGESLIRVTNPRAEMPRSGKTLFPLNMEFLDDDLAFMEVHLVQSSGTHLGSFVIPCQKLDHQLIFGHPEPL